MQKGTHAKEKKKTEEGVKKGAVWWWQELYFTQLTRGGLILRGVSLNKNLTEEKGPSHAGIWKKSILEKKESQCKKAPVENHPRCTQGTRRATRLEL